MRSLNDVWLLFSSGQPKPWKARKLESLESQCSGKLESQKAWKANVVILRRGIRPAMLMLANVISSLIFMTTISALYDDVNVLLLPFF